MNKTVKTTVLGVVAMAGLLAAGPARADRVSFGLGVGEGGSFFSLGVSGGDGHHGGRGHHRPPATCLPPAPPPPMCYPRPWVCAPPIAYVAAPVVVPRGYWREREERYWIEGCWVETFDPYGRRCRQWQPGRWEIRRIREWVQ